MFAASGPVFEVAKSVGLRVGCENSGGFFDNLQGAAYQSAVLMLNPDGEAPGKPGSRRFNVECAATMISREHLVTAAHCLCDDDASSTADDSVLSS